MEVQTEWRIAEAEPAAANLLASALEISPLTAQLLLNRGVRDEAAARTFLSPCIGDLLDPHTLPDMGLAVDRLQRAIEAKETIFIHGDYDVDGVTAAALCFRALTSLGGRVVGHVPRRSDGYDLQRAGVDKARDFEATLILTADCGSCAVDAISYATELGIDVIVTDHHRPGPTLPNAIAIVNPYRDDVVTTPAFRELCGAGVAFKLIDALCERVMPQHREAFRLNFLDLVALGTVADMTPLHGENRILVAQGLVTLTEAKKTGIKALLTTLRLDGKPIDTGHIGWQIGPRLNAAGRMEDADLAYRLLTTRDSRDAQRLAEELDALSARSRAEVARVTTEAVTQSLLPEHDDRRVLILVAENWGTGVVGIAAGRLAEQRRRPVILLSHDIERGICHGSARTYLDYNLHAGLTSCADLLHRFGGHTAAAGLSLPYENLAALRERMHADAEGKVPDIPPPPFIDIDAAVNAGTNVTFSLFQQFQQLAPFGLGNPEPTFVAYGAAVLASRRVGKDQNTCSLNLRLAGTNGSVKAVFFRNGDWADRVGYGDELDIVFTPTLNEWNGNVNVELTLKDIRIAGAAPSVTAQ